MIKKILHCIFLCMLSAMVLGQTAQEPLITPVINDTAITDSFFTQTLWDYEWFMIKDNEGNFSSSMADSLGNEIIDTTHIIRTANCTSNNRYEHIVRYASAYIQGDTLNIKIHDFTPAVTDELEITVVKNKFQTSFSTLFVVLSENNNVRWKTTRQKLILNKKNYREGDVILGRIEFECRESLVEENKKKAKSKSGLRTGKGTRNIHIKGPFKCVVYNKE